MESFEFIRDAINKTFLSRTDERLQYQGLPVVLVQARDSGLTEKGAMLLRDEGRELAER